MTADETALQFIRVENNIFAKYNQALTNTHGREGVIKNCWTSKMVFADKKIIYFTVITYRNNNSNNNRELFVLSSLKIKLSLNYRLG